MTNAIEIRDLQFSYNAQQRMVLDIPEFSLASGSCMFLHGPSGCGKSTLLNLLSATLNLHIHKQNKGSIYVLGQAIESMSSQQQDKFRAQHLGVVFQQLNLVDYLSVQDNIKIAHKFSGASGSFSMPRLEQVMNELNLPLSIISRRARDLSTGQQQRVAIARALYNQPPLLIVDEPTSALDEQASAQFLELLLTSVKNLSASLLFVSHDMRLAKHFDQCVALTDFNRAPLASEDNHRVGETA